MENARYAITRNGETIEAGYGVETVCEEPGCEKKIDRGLGHLCGETPGGDEHGCGGYYCGQHLYMAPGPGMRDLCSPCCDKAEREQAEMQTA